MYLAPYQPLLPLSPQHRSFVIGEPQPFPVLVLAGHPTCRTISHAMPHSSYQEQVSRALEEMSRGSSASSLSKLVFSSHLILCLFMNALHLY